MRRNISATLVLTFSLAVLCFLLFGEPRRLFTASDKWIMADQFQTMCASAEELARSVGPDHKSGERLAEGWRRYLEMARADKFPHKVHSFAQQKKSGWTVYTARVSLYWDAQLWVAVPVDVGSDATYLAVITWVVGDALWDRRYVLALDSLTPERLYLGRVQEAQQVEDAFWAAVADYERTGNFGYIAAVWREILRKDRWVRPSGVAAGAGNI